MSVEGKKKERKLKHFIKCHFFALNKPTTVQLTLPDIMLQLYEEQKKARRVFSVLRLQSVYGA